MEKMIKLIIGICILSTLFNSCKKDENNISITNHIKYDKTEYDLSRGFYEINYQSFDVYSIGITLFSSGIIFDEVDGVIHSFSGTGHAVYFEIYSSESDIDVGNYLYDSDGIHDPGVYDNASVILNLDTQTLVGTELEITNGTLSVIKKENEYEITFDCIAEDGKSITGYYKGNIGPVIFI